MSNPFVQKYCHPLDASASTELLPCRLLPCRVCRRFAFTSVEMRETLLKKMRPRLLSSESSECEPLQRPAAYHAFRKRHALSPRRLIANVKTPTLLKRAFPESSQLFHLADCHAPFISRRLLAVASVFDCWGPGNKSRH